VEKLGTTGLIIWVMWKLVDRWAGRFLEVQSKQAEAMGALADAVRGGQGEQRELLIAVRVLATKVDETKEWVKELSDHIIGGAARGIAG
jgi:hypothetical protein